MGACSPSNPARQRVSRHIVFGFVGLLRAVCPLPIEKRSLQAARVGGADIRCDHFITKYHVWQSLEKLTEQEKIA